MTNSFKLKFHKWLILTLSWIVIGAALALFLDLNIDGEFISATEHYSLTLSLLAGMGGGLLGGLIGGSTMIFVFDEKLKGRPFAVKVLVNVFFVMVVILIVNIIISFFYYLNDVSIFGQGSFFEIIGQRFISRSHLISQLTWLTIVLLTTFAISVVDSFGPHVFLDMIFGKYHRPFAEQRIFMFLDLKSSTTIAERLGHQNYFEFLQEFYTDITNPVINSRGFIYQYVGDEVVLTWDMQHGIKDLNCLRCFFMIEKEILNLEDKYLKKYNVVPRFKAGLHYGTVTTGEVGILKKDIIHTGDVLNTTARIEKKCNRLNAKLLASKKLVDLFDNKEQYSFTSMGMIDLRGKMQMIELLAVEE